MRILTVFGTRPEAIKVAPIIHIMNERNLEVILCTSGQHREMLDQTLEVFGIKPNFDLNIMQENQSPLQVVARIMDRLGPIFENVKPDWLLVQGDTSTTFAATLVSFHLRTPIAHVEAGLRTHDKFHPFPEEMNRRLVSVAADLHFAPTQNAVDNLLKEEVPPENIFLTGNTIVDALLTILHHPVIFSDHRINDLKGRIVLVTVHRRENFGKPLEQICQTISSLINSYPDVTVIFPVHQNPSVSNTVFTLLASHPRIVLVAPLPYPQFVHLMKRADLILTDSGGIQEEAPSIGTPVLVLREVTERPEAIEAQRAELVGTSCATILARVDYWLCRPREIFSSNLPNPFGDGKASQRIVEILQAYG
jgi:UDP-N-acetylglucosamine 2-epimerase (non-hydrolysing)